MKEKILIVENRPDLIKGLKLNLSEEGFEVDLAVSGHEGLRKAIGEVHDLIILEFMSPGIDGTEVCRKLRQENIDIPVIMLTPEGGEIDKVEGTESGADDYITRPFSYRELLSRIKAHLRHGDKEENRLTELYSFDDVEIDFASFKVRHRGEELDLTTFETDILRYFIAHRDEVVTREDLLYKIWGNDSFPSVRTIDNHIVKLRRKIEVNPSHPKYIISVYGGGYRFTG